MEFLENRTFDEIKIGDFASLSRILTHDDINLFAIMSGDINPTIVDIEFAKSDVFKKIVGHGMWSGSLISTLLGTELPGPGTIYVNQSLKFRHPVEIGDTVIAKITVVEKNDEKHRIIFNCECRNQHNKLVVSGQAEVIAPTEKIQRKKIILPEVNLRRPSSLFDTYIQEAKEFDKIRAAVIQPIHEKVLQSVHEAASIGLIQPVLIGNKKSIQQAAHIAKIDIEHYELIEVDTTYDAINTTIEFSTKIDLIIRGTATKEDLLHAIRHGKHTLLTDSKLSYVSVLDIPTYNKPLIITDTLININPTLNTMRDIIQNAIEFTQALGIKIPKIALLSGSKDINSNLQSTINAAALCKMAERGQITGGILDGPLTFEDAISIEAATADGIISPIVGDIDVLVMPNMETGAIVAKQLEYLAESRNAGLLLGAKVPILMSHINHIPLGTAACALAILYVSYMKQIQDV